MATADEVSEGEQLVESAAAFESAVLADVGVGSLDEDPLSQWGIDWFIKAGQSGWFMNGKPIRDARLASRGYLRKAAAGNTDRFQELRETSIQPDIFPPDDREPPF